MTAATAAGRFAAEDPAGRLYCSIAVRVLRAPCCKHQHSAANMDSIMFRADK